MKQRSPKVREMTQEDLDEVMRISDLCGLETWSREAYVSELARPDSVCIVAPDAPDRFGKLSGFAVTRLITNETPDIKISELKSKDQLDGHNLTEREPDPVPSDIFPGGTGSVPEYRPEAEIYNIGVRPEMRRRGVGGALLETLFEIFARNDVGEVFLEVRARNLAAVQFYGSKGFAEQGRRAGFYKNPADDALIMRAELFCRKGR